MRLEATVHDQLCERLGPLNWLDEHLGDRPHGVVEAVQRVLLANG
jgi:hypothetical protein